MRDGLDEAFSESSLAFEVDIMNGMSVVRTLATSVESVTYTAAQQVTDFGSTQSSVTVRVYQMGLYGRGYVTQATV
jgi:hypothetical protein